MPVFRLNKCRSKWLLTAFLLSFTVLYSSCSIIRPSTREKVERKQAKEAQKAQKEYDKAMEMHMKNQSKEARKMMKKTRKQAKKFNGYMKKPFNKGPKCS